LSNNAEEAFAQLEKMVEELPVIQKEDARLSCAREARRLREAQKRATLLTAELEGYERTIDTALRDGKAAADRGDTKEEGRNLGLVRMTKEMHYTRLATQQRAQDELRKLLRQGTLTLEDALDDYALSDEEYETLEARVRDFREEYQRLYALCRHFEGLEDE
jgi:uncharacterized protein YecE (DUF72 family)